MVGCTGVLPLLVVPKTVEGEDRSSLNIMLGKAIVLHIRHVSKHVALLKNENKNFPKKYPKL